MFCGNVPNNFIYMKVLQDCSSVIWQECSIFKTPLHLQSDIFLNQIILLNLTNCILPIPFVNISTIISSLLQYFNSILFVYVIECNIDMFHSTTILRVLFPCSHWLVIFKNVIRSTEFSSISIRSRCNHVNSWAAFANAMYSVSDVDKGTQVCFLIFQLITAPLIIKTNPDVDF